MQSLLWTFWDCFFWCLHPSFSRPIHTHLLPIVICVYTNIYEVLGLKACSLKASQFRSTSLVLYTNALQSLCGFGISLRQSELFKLNQYLFTEFDSYNQCSQLHSCILSEMLKCSQLTSTVYANMLRMAMLTCWCIAGIVFTMLTIFA